MTGAKLLVFERVTRSLSLNTAENQETSNSCLRKGKGHWSHLKVTVTNNFEQTPTEESLPHESCFSTVTSRQTTDNNKRCERNMLLFFSYKSLHVVHKLKLALDILKYGSKGWPRKEKRKQYLTASKTRQQGRCESPDDQLCIRVSNTRVPLFSTAATGKTKPQTQPMIVFLDSFFHR